MPISNNNMIADYDFWVKFDRWDLEQMTSLLLGYNPIYFNKTLIYDLGVGAVETSMSNSDVEALVDEYKNMFALIMSSIESGTLKSRSSPLRCYKWSQSKSIAIFKEFHQAIQNTDLNKIANQDAYLNPKRRKQLYKIILSLAIRYKFNPDKNKNPSTSKMRDAIHRIGLNIDDNTIRDVIKTSYEMYKDDIDHSIFHN